MDQNEKISHAAKLIRPISKCHSGDFSFLTMRPIDVNASYGDSSSSWDLCNFKENFLILTHMEKNKCNLFGGQFSVHFTIITNVWV